jgi:hypothetical protein
MSKSAEIVKTPIPVFYWWMKYLTVDIVFGLVENIFKLFSYYQASSLKFQWLG